MKKSLIPVSVLLLIVACVSFAQTAPVAEEINIKISPHILILKSQSVWVTVHTNLPYSLVVPNTVELNDIPADLTKSDDRGNLVAKFHSSKIKPIVSVPLATLTLTGEKTDGADFFGSDTIEVKE